MFGSSSRAEPGRLAARGAIAAVLLLAAAPGPSRAQFGQNKVTYETFDWRVYESPHFNVHYYPATELFLEEVVSYAESAYLKISRDLDHELRFKVPLVIYKTHGEFQQTNIALGELPEGVAAFAEPVQNRMVLPIDLPPDKLYELISHELVHIFQYSMFFEGYLGRALRARPPTWLIEGMASYFGRDEDNLDRMVIRDAVVNNVLPPIKELEQVTFLTYRYGHAIFDYIEQEHGLEGLRSFLFEYRKVLLSNNLEKAFKEAFGYGLDEFNRRFNRYLRQKYLPVLLEKKSPEDYGTEIGLKRPGTFTFSPVMSPSGELVAVLATPKLELDLMVLSAEDGSKVKNLTRGWTNSYRSLVARAFEGKRDLSWSPTTDEIAVFSRRENTWPLQIYDALRGKHLRTIVLDDIVECGSPAYSPDGKRIAFEGNRDGVVDIFEVELATEQVRNLTQDDYFDANPWYAADGVTLLYNRRIGSSWKIFSVDLADHEIKHQLTFGSSSDLEPSYSRDGKSIYFSSDRGPYGVFNIWSLDLGTAALKQHIDVVGGCFAPVEMAAREGQRNLVFAAYFGGQFRLYRMPLGQAVAEVGVDEQGAGPEATVFEPPLTLTVDQQLKHPYKLKWDIEAPSISVGVADDGTLLTDAAVQFSDLLGDHRALILASTVSNFATYQAAYLNIKHRLNWGASVFDFRDFYLRRTSSGLNEQTNRRTGLSGFLSYPLSRHYRFETEIGVEETAQDLFTGQFDSSGLPTFGRFSDRYGLVDVAFVGDTTRLQSFGPFQGKRFRLSTTFAPHLSGDLPGDMLEYRLDYRGYLQATRRSLLALRLATIYNDGDRASLYGFGGLNQLRGFSFREFLGSHLAWANVEFRFPLVDRLDFPVLRLAQIRGFFFFDVGAAWGADNVPDDSWWDPKFGNIRVQRVDTVTTRIIPFRFWDSDNDRLQDGRASYGGGFQFLFLGGLQFNWAWAHPLAYTQFCDRTNQSACVYDPTTTNVLEKRRERPGSQFNFYIQFDF